MIVADTHAWVWWVGSRHLLSKTAAKALDEATVIGVPVISCWEVAMLVTKKRLVLDRDVSLWIDEALALPSIRLLELTPDIAVASTRLHAWNNEDPADRLIVATALSHRAQIVSKDRRIRSFRPALAIW